MFSTIPPQRFTANSESVQNALDPQRFFFREVYTAFIPIWFYCCSENAKGIKLPPKKYLVLEMVSAVEINLRLMLSNMYLKALILLFKWQFYQVLLYLNEYDT